ncbi:Protein CL16A [Coemansia sp. RSA 988]|nr:Protein CL16A [Coemansia sp. RSA 988]
MFGTFLTLFGGHEEEKEENEQSLKPRDGSSNASTKVEKETKRRRETEQKREQIIKLADYLQTATVRHSTYKKIVESVRQVSEVVIWSDRRNPELLSFIIEVELHQSMLRLLLPPVDTVKSGNWLQQQTDRNAVGVQILQTFSIILDSVTDERFMYSLFSNNFVNQVIAAPVDMENEEVVSYYVAFLKALSLKLTPNTIHFFFNELMDDFPLYTTAINLFDHSDSMVRVAVRAITLNVFRINDPDALEFILNAPACTHFWEQIMCALKDSYDDAFRILIDMRTGSNNSPAVDRATTVIDAALMTEVQEWAALDQVLEMHMGLLAYLNDIFGLGVHRINRRVASEFRDRILTRTYVHTIEIGWRAEASTEETLFMQVSTLFLAHFFAIVRYSPLLIDTISALFSPASIGQPDTDDHGNVLSRLAHPFIPSPFEPSRTLIPWLCVVLEALRNKAISPTAFVKSVLTPRRMLRTRALLESLTGTASIHDCCSSSNRSVLTMSPIIPASNSPPLPLPSVTPLQLEDSAAYVPSGTQTPRAQSVAPAAVAGTGHAPLPPFTQTIATAMVQILSDFPPSHNWITIDLAALLLVQLTRNARGHLILDSSLSDELHLAQRTHSAELRAMLLAVDNSSTSETNCPDEGPDCGPIGCGSWKVLVQCLVDMANSDSETLGIKVQSEARHIFATERLSEIIATAPTMGSTGLPSSLSSNRRGSSESSATARNTNNINGNNIASASPQSSSHKSLHTLQYSPFDSGTPRDTSLAASIHQAFHLGHLCRAADNHSSKSVKINPRAIIAPDLQKWLGTHLAESPNSGEDENPLFTVTVIDNAVKQGLPRNITRLGFHANIQCREGCLLIRYPSNIATEDNLSMTQPVELVWPLADVSVVSEDDHSDDGSRTVLRIRDTVFPQLFYPPRPTSVGGINTSARRRKISKVLPQQQHEKDEKLEHLIHFSYFGSKRPLDLSFRSSDDQSNSILHLLRTHIAISRKRLADIFISHGIV